MKNKFSGYTLIEMMMALGLGLVITAAVVTAYVSSKENTDRTTDVSNMQEVARLTLSILREEISMAGFFGHLQYELVAKGGGANFLNSFGTGGSTKPRVFVSPQGTAIPNDCTMENNELNNGSFPNNVDDRFIWFYAYEVPATGSSNLKALNSSCVSSAKKNSDVIQIKRVIADEKLLNSAGTHFEDVEDDKLYLLTEPLTAGFAMGSQIKAAPRPFADTQVTKPSAWEYLHRVYYIKDGRNNNQGTPIPTLTRRSMTFKLLSNDIHPAMGGEEEVIEGVEAIHIDYGFDTSASDDRVDRYISTGSATDELVNNNPVVVVSLYILVRDLDITPGFNNTAGERTYQMGRGKTLTFTDDYKRQMISSNVLLYNGIEASWVENSIADPGGSGTPSGSGGTPAGGGGASVGSGGL